MTIELFREYRVNPSRRLRDRIFTHHYKLACEIAHQFRICCDEPLEDLIQLASMGLIKAVERFDPDRGNAFSSFACPYIKGEITHYLRDKSSIVKIPRSLQSLYQQGKRLGKSDTQTAESLGCSLQEWIQAKAIAGIRIPLSVEGLLRLEWANENEIIDSTNVDISSLDIARIKRFFSALHFHNQQGESRAIDPLSTDTLNETSRQLVEMFFFQGKSLTHIKKSAIASGIKDLKSHLLGAALELCRT